MKNVIRAEDLTGAHIGTMARFGTFDERREIVTITTAELRQIYHKSGDVTVYFGDLGERDETLFWGTIVTLDPPADYSDAAMIEQSLRDVVTDD